MRSILSIMIAALTLVWLSPAPVAAEQKGVRAKKAKMHVRYVRRPASVGQNGLCQRDTGTPESQLDFRNKCDTEEFWNRIIGRGGSGDK